jgi:hypothetical protein
MKNVIFYLFLVCGIATGQAQDVIELDETRLTYSPNAILIDSDLNSTELIIAESYSGEFEENPMRFMLENFDITSYIEKVQDKKYDSYLITFRSRKGFLEAEYDKQGRLGRTYLRFKNIVLPSNMITDLHRKYEGWKMVRNIHVASGHGGFLSKDVYKVKLKKGRETKNLKIGVNHIDGSRVAVLNQP